MTTYILYRKADTQIVRIDSTGSATSDGPDRGPEAYSNDRAFIDAHRVWKVPVIFFQKLRLDVLHSIGSHATIVLNTEDNPVGIQVQDRPALEARRRTEVRQALVAQMVEANAAKRKLQDFIVDNPALTDKTEIQALEAIVTTEETTTVVEYERVLAGGVVPLSPILDSKAGEVIRLDV